MANATSTELQELYVAYFGRAADPTGLDYWTEKGITTAAFAANMYAQNEFKSVYGDLTTEAQVNQIYKNLFDREADVTGLTYWTKEINLGNLELAEIAVHLIWAAKNNDGGSDDKTALSNKTSAAVAYTAKVKESTSAILAYAAESTDPWTSGDNITEAVNYMSGIDKDTAHTTAGIASSVTTITNNGTQTGKRSFNLTTGVETLTGGSAADTFDASATAGTLNNGDVLDGGGSANDKLTAKFTTATTALVNSKNIELFDLTTTGVATTLNLSSTSGVTKIQNLGSTGDLTLNNLDSATTTFTINTNGDNTVLNYANSALSGTTDDIAITLEGATSAAEVHLTIAAGGTNKAETVSLVSSTAANTLADLQTTAVGTTTLEITGDQNLTITADLDVEIATVSAANATGDLNFEVGNITAASVTTGSGADTIEIQGKKDTIDSGAGNDLITASAQNGVNDITSGAGDDTVNSGTGNDIIKTGDGDDKITNSGAGDKDITAGAGNDDIHFTYDGLTADDTVAGGAGTADKITLTSSSASGSAFADTAFTKVTGVETLTSVSNTIELFGTIDSLAAAAGIDTVTFVSTDAADEKITIGSGFSNALTVNLSGTNDQDDVDATAYTKKLTVNAGALGLGTTNNLTGGTGTEDTLTLTGTSHTLTNVAGFEVIKGASNAATTVSILDGNVADGKSIHVDGSALTDTVFTVDASAEADGKNSITGGGGDDVITASQSDNADTLVGGAGNDTFKFAIATIGSTDSVDGGAGTADILTTTDTTAAVSGFVDADFTLVSNVEVLKGGSITLELFATLDSLASAAGIDTVTFVSTDAAQEKVTITSGFSNDLTVNLSGTNDEDDVDATAYTKKLTVAAGALGLGATNNLTGGTGTTDTITLTGTSHTLTNVAGFEVIQAASNAATTVSVLDANVADGKTMHVDGSALTSTVFTVDASAEADGKNSITGGAGDDVITISQSDLGDTITGGAGNDTFKFNTGTLTKLDSIDGGSGTADILHYATDGTTVVDADFTLVSNVEILEGAAGSRATSLTVGAEAAGAGITTINLKDTSAVDLLTIGSDFSSNLTVDLDEDTTGNKIVASAFTNNLTVTAAEGDLDNGDSSLTTITGGSGTDELKLTADAATLITTDVSGITNFEKVTIVSTTIAASWVSADENATYTDAADYQTITIDASSMTTGIFTFDGTLEVDAKTVVIGGGANDILITTASANFGDDISGGAGNDTIRLANATALTSIDTINGGAGNADILESIAATAGTYTDGNFTNVTNMEIFQGDADSEINATIGAQFQEAGFSTVKFKGNAANSLTVSSDFTNALAVELNETDVDDNIDGSASSAALTITGLDDVDVEAGDTIKGGTSTGDVLKIVANGASAGATGAVTTLMTGIETITMVYTANKDGKVAMGANDTQIADGKTLTVNAAAMTETDESFHFIGTTSETDGFLNITGSAGADSIVGADAADTISGGTGADSITGNKGADSITGGAGADDFIIEAVEDSTTNSFDTITDFTTASDEFKVTIDHSATNSAINANLAVLTAGAGITAVQNTLSAKVGEAIYDTTNSKLYINVNADALITTQDYAVKVNAATTAANTIADGDIDYTFKTGSANDTIASAGGTDTIYAGAGADTISGGAGGDVIYGEAGVDTLLGGAGVDSLYGGLGDDVITLDTTTDDDVVYLETLKALNGTDTVANFSAASGGDQIAFNWGVGTSAISQTDLGINTASTGLDAVILTQDGSAGANAGLVIWNADCANEAALETVAHGLDDAGTGDQFYFVQSVDVSEAEGANIWHVTVGANAGATAATQIATLSSVIVSDLAAANFTDFS